jgi:zinc D-Ala-D-Ala dipeptidase
MLNVSQAKFYFQLFILFFLFQNRIGAQTLKVISSTKEYNQSIKNDPNNKLLDLRKLIPTIVLDLKYSTTSNFMNYKLYENARTTYMRTKPANALLQIQKSLAAKGFGLKIFDAYRPYSITKKMWELIHDERYVANPANGSGHNRGISIDLTIVNLKTGIALDMGTTFDNFTDSAHHNFTAHFKEAIITNRNLLKTTMIQFGFKPLETEWWHYSWVGSESYEVLDISFEKMGRMNEF